MFITRDTVIKLAKSELNLKVVERTIDRTEVYLADEAFLCGSAMEITPIYSIDRYTIGTGKIGTNTKLIHSKYIECVHGRCRQKMKELTRCQH